MSTDLAKCDYNGDGESEVMPWGGYEMEIDSNHYFPNTGDQITDFDGQVNTARIVAFLNEDTHDSYFTQPPYSAAGVCADYTFENGQKGYLWAAGEENIAVKYKSTISSILNDLSKTDWASNNVVWSSTQGSQRDAWSCLFNGSYWGLPNKSYRSYVVPVCAFPLSV